MLAALIELVLIRPLYRRPVEQVLVTVGLAFVLNALVEAIWGFDARPFPVPSWMIDTTSVLGASIPNDRFVEIAARRARPRRPERVPSLHALRPDHPRRRREPGDGDRARDRRAQGLHARLRARRRSWPRSRACSPASTTASSIPSRGTSLLIFAFIVVVIGGFGSIGGTAVAAVAVGLIQQYANYYASSGLGDLAVVLLLAIVLLLKPEGLAPKVAH